MNNHSRQLHEQINAGWVDGMKIQNFRILFLYDMRKQQKAKEENKKMRFDVFDRFHTLFCCFHHFVDFELVNTK